MAGLPIAVDITPPDAPREHVTVLLAACARASAEAECVPAEGVPASGSRAVALVTWHGDRRAVIEVGLRKDGRPAWRSRTLDFDRRDDPAERWRTVGFVVGTLSRPEVEVPESETSSPETAAKASVVAPKVADSPAPPAKQVPTKPPPRAARTERPQGSPRPPRRAEAAVRPVASSGRARSAPGAALDAGGVVGSALEGLRFGGLVRGRFAIVDPLGGIVAVRYQERPMGDGSFGGRWLSGAAGVALHFSGGPLELSVSLDGRVEYFHARAAVGDRRDENSRVLPGAGIGIHGGWMPTDAFGLFVGVNGSAMFGTTDISVSGAPIARDFPLRVAAEGGVRLRLW